MTWMTLSIFSGFIALLHAGPLAGMGPGLPLAFAAWVMVATETVFLVPRLAVIALIFDVLIPGPGWVWTLSLLLGAVLFLPIRPFLFHGRPLSWTLGAIVLVLVDSLVCVIVGGSIDPGPCVVRGGEVILLALCLGLGLRNLPEWLSPAGRIPA